MPNDTLIGAYVLNARPLAGVHCVRTGGEGREERNLSPCGSISDETRPFVWGRERDGNRSSFVYKAEGGRGQRRRGRRAQVCALHSERNTTAAPPRWKGAATRPGHGIKRLSGNNIADRAFRFGKARGEKRQSTFHCDDAVYSAPSNHERGEQHLLAIIDFPWPSERKNGPGEQAVADLRSVLYGPNKKPNEQKRGVVYDSLPRVRPSGGRAFIRTFIRRQRPTRFDLLAD